MLSELRSSGCYVGPIEEQALENDYFMKVVFTGNHYQMMVMCLQPEEEIGKVHHINVDQFFSIVQGEADIVLGDDEIRQVKVGDAVIVQAGTDHNVINTSRTAKLKLYTLYSRPNHAEDAVYKTKAEAEDVDAAEVDRFPD